MNVIEKQKFMIVQCENVAREVIVIRRPTMSPACMQACGEGNRENGNIR